MKVSVLGNKVTVRPSLEALKNKYLKLISEADMLGDTEEKIRLQQEYAQKKAEIEAMTY